ncbi:MAG: lipid A biosynthesis acyltransferase, partial [Thermoguttaceae bacterium]|nr:lipid A biosynthesis acyltransferase [Thermoguttaceae bacterium]
AFLADQSAGPKGCWIRFFGRRASAYKAMALLSIEYDAPIIVCCATRRNNTPLMFNMQTLAMLDPRNRPDELSSIAQITQWFSSELEKNIRQYPDQYWWIHNRWKTYGKTFHD